MTEETSAESPSAVEKKIIQQVEYYFGDMNLPRDRFLQEEMKKDEGWIPLEILMKFNRLKTLSTDIELIVSALKKSDGELIEISEDNTKVRRVKSKPLPENRLEFWQQLKTRTLYVKGFPLDAQLDQIMEFFAKYGSVENVLMRRTKDAKRNFKGSVFVTFSSRDLCQAFIDAESVKFGDTELIRLFESDYFKKKVEEKKQIKMKINEEKRAAKEQQSNKNNDTDEKPEELSYASGRVIHLKNLPDKNLDRDVIRKTFAECGEVDWVDYKRGDKEAFIRFNGKIENPAVPVLSKMKEKNNNNENKVKIDEIECEAEILTGDDEKAYWVRTQEEKKAAYERKKGFSKKGRPNKSKDWKNKRNPRRSDGKVENGKAKTEDKPKIEEKMESETRDQSDKKSNQTETLKRPAESECSAEPAVKLAKSDE